MPGRPWALLMLSTCTASGNALLTSGKPGDERKAAVEAVLIESFTLDSELIKPEAFGEQPENIIAKPSSC